MRKKILSLCMALALCLGLLPVTALAEGTAPQTLYVGSTTISAGYWTSSDGGTTWARQENQPEGNNYIYYDGQGTLKLHNATIQGGSITGSAPFGSGIYALSSSNQPVTLTIELIGENTITGTFGIYVNATPPTTPGTDASLVIKKSGDNGDNGSLTVTGTGNSGLHIISGTGDASLTIKNASVDAKTTQTYSSYAGVCVQSGASATGSPQLSLAVNGGSLTASGTGSRDGILFYVGSSQATGATTSLTVSENAIVDARNGGISALKISETLPTPTPTGNNSSGIVFDDKNGTVYGTVELQNDLTIGEGESLTVPEGASLTVPDGKTLTNNGTVTTEEGGTLTNNGKIDNSGTLPDNIQGSAPPKITTTSLPYGEVDKNYSQPLAATGNDTITWSSSDLPEWLTLDSNGTISGTPTAADTYNFTVTATNGNGSDSKAFTLTVTQPVTGVTLDPTSLSLFTGDTATLTATVQPSNATNQNVTWQSDNANVATVEGGTVTAVGAGETDITVTTEDGGKTATCHVTVTQSTYSISADTTALNFGSVYTGYAQPAAKEVTITNTGNRPQTLTLTASTGSFEVGTLTKTQLAAGEKATFTVQPKAGLAVGTYSENITISGTHDVNETISATFTVKQYSSGGGTPTKTPSQQAVDKIESAKDGSTVEIKLSTGSTKLDKEVFEELAGRDVTLEISLSNGVTWTVNGQDIPENADLTDLDMGVSLNTSTIPVNLINAVTGEIGTVQLTLKHDGEFGFTMTLTAPVGAKNAGLWANLYHYDEDAGKMVYQTAALVDKDGNVALPFDHASQYALVLDSKSHELPFTDLTAGAWYLDAVACVYRHDIMEGMSATTFQPNGTLSRAMAVQIFYNLEGQPDISGENLGYPYEDVDAQAWYGDAVYWARITGVATGYGDGTFQPTDSITRQEFAQMLYNYAKYKGYDLTAEGDLAQFPDSGSVADWAETAMSWANGNELINGHDNGTIDAAGTAIRAQAASILMRFDQNLVEK